MEETDVQIVHPPKTRLPGIFYILIGIGISLLAFLFAWPKYTAKIRKEAYIFGYNEGKVNGLTLGEASGFDRAMVEYKAVADSIAELDSLAEVKAEEELAKKMQRRTKKPANYRVIQTDTGYVVGDPIPDE